MKKLLILSLLAFTACTTVSYRYEWLVDVSNQAEVDKFRAVEGECKDFAYRSKVAGSRFTENDILTSCIQHRGYQITAIAQ